MDPLRLPRSTHVEQELASPWEKRREPMRGLARGDLVTATDSPPDSGTRTSWPPPPGAYTITPSGPHVPPNPGEAFASVWTRPLSRSIRFRWPPEKNPTERPSGFQKGRVAASVPSGAARCPRPRRSTARRAGAVRFAAPGTPGVVHPARSQSPSRRACQV